MNITVVLKLFNTSICSLMQWPIPTSLGKCCVSFLYNIIVKLLWENVYHNKYLQLLKQKNPGTS